MITFSQPIKIVQFKVSHFHEAVGIHDNQYCKLSVRIIIFFWSKLFQRSLGYYINKYLLIGPKKIIWNEVKEILQLYNISKELTMAKTLFLEVNQMILEGPVHLFDC